MDLNDGDMQAISREEVEVMCLPCDQEGTSTKATCYCVECESPYCPACWKTHNRFPAMRTHTVLNEDQKMKWNDNISGRITSVCDVHAGKPVDMFCADHDQVACSACIAIHHRACASVKYVPSIASGKRASLEYQELIDSLKSQMVTLAKAKSSRESYLCKRTDDYDAIAKQIDHFKELLVSHINHLVEDSKRTLRAHLSKTNNDIGHQIRTIDLIIDELNTHLKKLHRTENEPQLFVDIKETKFRQKHITKSSVDVVKSPSVSPITCCLDTNLLSRSSIAKIENSKVVKPIHLNKINVKIDTDTSVPDVVGMIKLMTGKMCVLDNSNKKLKLLDHSLNIKDNIALEDYALGLTVISDNTVAVSVRNLKKIQIVEVASDLKLLKSFSTDQICHGICFDAENGELYVCCGDNTSKNGPGRVKVFSKTGHLKRTIDSENGDSFFSSPVNVTFSNTTQVLYVCDKENGVIALAFGRHKLWSFKDSEIVPWGICLIPDEQMFVCGPASNNVLRLTRNGISEGYILTRGDGIQTPSSLFFDNQSTSVLIGLYGDHVMQYRLEMV